MTSDPNINHLVTLFRDAHWRSLDSICSHPLEAEEIAMGEPVHQAESYVEVDEGELL